MSGQRSLFLWMPIIAALSAMGIGSGGTMSYGILHGYAQSDTLINYAYGFVTLFLQGSAWGTFGGALIGLMLERKPMRNGEWLGLDRQHAFCRLGHFVSGRGRDRVPRSIRRGTTARSASWGLLSGSLIWLACNKKPSGLRGAVLGYVGFGLGMAGGRLLGNCCQRVAISVWLHDQPLERDGDVVRVHRRVHLLLWNGRPAASGTA